ncbi:MAG TPA: AI-2E family transporter [Rhodocyclaceae bacterium]|nr:AI-2E family transporter [Rhodocyclaceae bacterium]
MSANTPVVQDQIGPLVWGGIIASTCLLLAMLQKALFLVVPFLLALVLYYVLFPPMQWLMFRGLKRNWAASVVMALFLVVAGVYLSFFLPWLADHLVDWQVSLARYVDGGMGLLKRTLRGIERSSSMLAHAHVSEEVQKRLSVATANVGPYLEPAVVGVATWAPSLLLAPFVSYFFLRDGGLFKRMLGRAVPNAFFEKTLYLLHEVDQTARAYFHGLLGLTVLDTLTLAAGLWWIGLPAPLVLGLVCAVLAWLPFVGSVLGGLLVVLVAGTDFPQEPAMAYWSVALFLCVRFLDDFLYMPLTIGRKLHMHPLLSVMMIFIGGAVAGVPGLMLVLPLLGVVMVVGRTLGKILTDPRLIARYRHGRRLQAEQASADLR